MKNVAKKPKEVLIEAYEALFKQGAFKGSELDVVVEKVEKVVIKEKKEEKETFFEFLILFKMKNEAE